jgi:hypothetical protein
MEREFVRVGPWKKESESKKPGYIKIRIEK